MADAVKRTPLVAAGSNLPVDGPAILGGETAGRIGAGGVGTARGAPWPTGTVPGGIRARRRTRGLARRLCARLRWRGPARCCPRRRQLAPRGPLAERRATRWLGDRRGERARVP